MGNSLSNNHTEVELEQWAERAERAERAELKHKVLNGDEVSKNKLGFVTYLPPMDITFDKDDKMYREEPTGAYLERRRAATSHVPNAPTYARVPPGITIEELTASKNCTAFALGLDAFYQVPRTADREAAKAFLEACVPKFAYEQMGNLKGMFWPYEPGAIDFHWARVLRNGMWAEKRGFSGVYVWKTKQAMLDDVKSLGYADPIEFSFN